MVPIAASTRSLGLTGTGALANLRAAQGRAGRRGSARIARAPSLLHAERRRRADRRPTMADREMIAATLAAALLSGQDFSAPHSNPAGHAVTVYHQVLAALDAAESPAPPHPPNPSSTP